MRRNGTEARHGVVGLIPSNLHTYNLLVKRFPAPPSSRFRGNNRCEAVGLGRVERGNSETSSNASHRFHRHDSISMITELSTGGWE